MDTLTPCSTILAGLRSCSVRGVDVLKKLGVDHELATGLIKGDRGEAALRHLQDLERFWGNLADFVPETVRRLGDPSPEFMLPPGISDSKQNGANAFEALKQLLLGQAGPALVRIAEAVKKAEPEMRKIPSGVTILGSPKLLSPEQNGIPDYWWGQEIEMAKTPLTAGQYGALVEIDALPPLRRPPWQLNDDLPAVQIGWGGFKEFALILNALTGVEGEKEREYRPPWAHEFEWAARGHEVNLLDELPYKPLHLREYANRRLRLHENAVNGDPFRAALHHEQIINNEDPLTELFRNYWRIFRDGAEEAVQVSAWNVYGTSDGTLKWDNAVYRRDRWWISRIRLLRRFLWGPPAVTGMPENSFGLIMTAGGVRQMVSALWKRSEKGTDRPVEWARVFPREVETSRSEVELWTGPVAKGGSWGSKDETPLMAAFEEPYHEPDIFTGARLVRGRRNLPEKVRIAGERS